MVGGGGGFRDFLSPHPLSCKPSAMKSEPCTLNSPPKPRRTRISKQHQKQLKSESVSSHGMTPTTLGDACGSSRFKWLYATGAGSCARSRKSSHSIKKYYVNTCALFEPRPKRRFKHFLGAEFLRKKSTKGIVLLHRHTHGHPKP